MFLVLAMAALLPLAPPLSRLSPLAQVSLQACARMIGVAVATAIFLLTWNTRRGQTINIMFAGFGFLATAALGAAAVALLSGIAGMSAGANAHVLAVLGLAADSTATAALLVAALGPARAASPRAIRIGVALMIVEAWLGLQWAWSPPRRFDLISQAVAGTQDALLLLAGGLHLRRYLRGHHASGLLALASFLAGIGVALGTGQAMDGTSRGVVDEACKALAWLVVYRALFRLGVQAPRRRLVESGLAVEEDRQRYRQLFDSAPDGLLLVDSTGTIVEANPAAAAMFGWSPGGILGQSVDMLVPQHLRARHEGARTAFQAAPKAREMRGGEALLAVRQDGKAFPVEVALVPQAFGDRPTTLCIVRDVTERRQLEKSLMRLALHDALTELPNRRHFSESLTKALAHADRHGGTLAVLFIDLDNFKQVNDSLGHSQGDELLRQVARRLSQALRASDLLARMGGDEFALLLQGAGPEDAAAVAEKVLRLLESPFEHAGQTMKVGASIGITVSPADGREIEDLLSNADLAMYRAKEHGRNTWRVFEHRMTESLRTRSALQQDLPHAIERNQFALVFQPRVRTCDGALTGFESLLRWRHPEQGDVAPDVFIQLAEESGQMVAIGEWVLRKSCEQAARWRLAGAEGLTMAVNVSTHQLRHAAFAAQVQQVLAATGWPAAQLELEITETALMEDPQDAAVLLHQLVSLGVRLAVDDFGTGYSSLAYLKDYPLHRLKVDRRFVHGLHPSSRDCVIAASIIQLAHALGLQVTAEGVETSHQREFLVQHQCDELQGYLFSKPIPAEACEIWLQTAMRMRCRA